jgi:hypothetical protein
MGLFSESPHLWLNGTGTISILWGSLCSLIPRQIGFSEAMIFWELQSVGCGCCWRWPQWSHGGSVPCPCESPGGSAREAACTGWRSSHGGDCPGVQILKSKLPSELTSARHYPVSTTENPPFHLWNLRFRTTYTFLDKSVTSEINTQTWGVAGSLICKGMVWSCCQGIHPHSLQL